MRRLTAIGAAIAALAVAAAVGYVAGVSRELTAESGVVADSNARLLVQSEEIRALRIKLTAAEAGEGVD